VSSEADLEVLEVIENVEHRTAPLPGLYILRHGSDAPPFVHSKCTCGPSREKPSERSDCQGPGSRKAAGHRKLVQRKQIEAEPLLQSRRSLRPLGSFVVKDKKRISLFPFPTFCGSKPRELCLPTHASDKSPVAGPLAHLEETLRHTIIECGNRAIVNPPEVARFQSRCSDGDIRHQLATERWSRRVEDMLTSYELCWYHSLGTWDVKWRVGVA